MATRAEVEEYQSAIDGLTTVAFAQVKALLQALDQPNPIAFRDALLATYPDLLAPYLASAGEVAAVWYSALRSGAGLSVPFVAQAASPAPVEQLESGVRYALSPLFRPQEFIGSDVLSLLAGFTQRMIADQGRSTVEGNAVRDSVRVGWARVPSPGCCAFCGLLASRGAVYRSEESAGGVVGRGVDAAATAGKRGGQGRGVRARGSASLGDGYHNFCRCTVVPVFRGLDDPDNELVRDTQKKYDAMYAEAVSTDLSDYSRRNPDGPQFGSTSYKATLQLWRERFNTK